MALKRIVPNIEEIQNMQKTLPWITLDNLDQDGLEGFTKEQKEGVIDQTKLVANQFINGTLKGYDDFDEVFEDIKSVSLQKYAKNSFRKSKVKIA